MCYSCEQDSDKLKRLWWTGLSKMLKIVHKLLIYNDFLIMNSNYYNINNKIYKYIGKKCNNLLNLLKPY